MCAGTSMAVLGNVAVLDRNEAQDIEYTTRSAAMRFIKKTKPTNSRPNVNDHSTVDPR